MSCVNVIPPNDDSLLLIPQDAAGTKFAGYIVVKDEEYRVEVVLKDANTLDGASLHCEWKVAELMTGYQTFLAKRLQQSSTLAAFLEEFKVLLENLLSFQENPCRNTSTDISAVVKEIGDIGWEKLMFTNEHFTVLKFTHRDDADRLHVITIKLDTSTNTGALPKIVCLTDLPVAFESRYSKNEEGALKNIYSRFTQVVGSFQRLWATLDEIDKKCWILEPENVTYACTYRRIALGKNASIYIQLDAAHPTEFPECRFLGSDNVIEPLKQKLNTNLTNWNTDVSLLDNLEHVLEIEFPSPTSVDKDEINVTCGICYSYRLDQEIPEVTCDDTRCGQAYHNSCLAEWLRSLPTCRQSFNIVFGECPYCNKTLTVRLNKTHKP